MRHSKVLRPGTHGVIAIAFATVLAVFGSSAHTGDGDVLHTMTHGGLEREYLLYSPRGLTEGRLFPMVMVFHGGGMSARRMADLGRFQELAERDTFFVVHPNAVDRNWRDGRVNARPPVDDVGFVAELIGKLIRELPVDPKRVYATGASNGAIFSHYLAAGRADLVAAIAPAVGGIARPFNERFKPARPVSVMIMQGTEDPLVPYGGGSIGAGNQGEVVSTDETVRLWVESNGCGPTPTKEDLPDLDPSDGCTVSRFTWSGGREGTEVVLYQIHGGGHTWPNEKGRDRQRAGAVCRDFDGFEAAWDFFKAHPRR